MSPRPHPLDYAVIKRFVRCSIRQPCSLGRLSCWGPCDAIDTITHDTYAPPGVETADRCPVPLRHRLHRYAMLTSVPNCFADDLIIWAFTLQYRRHGDDAADASLLPYAEPHSHWTTHATTTRPD
jgi:hypothetical protein